jgi:hypothetical protein
MRLLFFTTYEPLFSNSLVHLGNILLSQVLVLDLGHELHRVKIDVDILLKIFAQLEVLDVFYEFVYFP